MAERSVIWKITTSFAKARKDADRLGDSMERLEERRDELDSNTVDGNKKVAKSTEQRNRAQREMARQAKAAASSQKATADAALRAADAMRNATKATQEASLASQKANLSDRERLANSQKLSQAQQRLAQAELSRSRATLALTSAQQRLLAIEKQHGKESENYARGLLTLQRRQLDLDSSSNRYIIALGRVNDEQNAVSGAAESVSGALGGLGGALKSLASQATTLAQGGLGTVAGKIAQIGTITPTVTSAIGFLLGAVSNLTSGLISLVGPLLNAASAAAAIPQAFSVAAGAIATFMAAFSGIGDALSAGIEQQENAGKAAKQNADAQRNAARAIQNALRALKDAHEAVAEAIRNEQKAQKAITEARKEARRELEDMNDALEDMALRQRGASLSVEEARRRLQEVMLDPASDNLARAQAQLAYDEALEQMDDVRRESERAKKDTAEANKKGVEGSDRVVAALEAHRDALKAVKDAQEGVKRAEEALADARRSAATSTAAATAGVDKFAQAMNDLSPAGQRFVRLLLGMRDEMQRLKFAAQEGLLPGLGEALTTMLKLVPLAEKGLFQFGQTMANTAKKGANLLTSDEFMPMWQRLLRSNNKLLRLGGDAFLNLVEAVVYLMDAARPFTEWLAKSIKGWTDYIAQVSKAGNQTGNTAKSLEGTQKILTTFGNILKNLWKIFKNVFGAGMDLGNDLWKSFENLTAGWAEWTGSIEGQNRLKEWFDAARGPLHELGQIIGGLVKGFFELGVAGSGNTTKILKSLQELGPPLLDMFTQLVQSDYLPALIDGLTQFGIAVANVMPAVANGLAPIAKALAEIAGWFAKLSENDAVAQFVALAVVASTLATAFKFLSFVFAPLLNLLKPLSPLFSKLGNILKIVGTNIRWAIVVFNISTGVIALVAAAIAGLVATFVYLWKASDDFRNFWKGLWDGIVNGVVKAIQNLSGPFKKELDKWADLFKPAQKAGSNLWKVLKPILYGIGSLMVLVGGIIGNVLKRVLPPLLEGLGKAFIALMGVVRNVFAFFIKLFSGDFKGAFQSFVAIFGKAFEAIGHLLAGAWNVIWGIVSGIVEGIIGFFKFLYDVLVGHSIVPDLMNAIVWWFKFLAKVIFPIVKKAVGLVLKVFKAVFPVILNVVKLWWAGIKVIFGLLKAFFTSVVVPAVKIILAIFKAVFPVILNVVKLWWEGVKVIFGLMKSFFESVIWPVLQWLWDRFKWVFARIVQGAKVYIAIFKKVWSKIKDWIIDPIVKAWPKIKDAWERIKAAFSKAFDIIKRMVTTVWSKIKDWIINPIQKAWEKISPIIDKIKEAFRVMKEKVSGWMSALSKAIGKVWDGIGEVVRGGANLAIKVVNALISTYNATIAKVPGVGEIEPLNEIPKQSKGSGGGMAKGGIYPGYTPGRDIGYIGISGGEAVMRPEWTRAIGADRVHEMNRIARTGGVSALRKRFRGNFADGGIPATGAWTRHASGYAFPAYDINEPGAGDYGNPVRAYKDGTVAEVVYLGDRSYGRYIKINHSDNTQTLYAHLSAASVTPGMAVKRGQVIGKVGDLGNASGPHLHFEIRGGTSAIIPNFDARAAGGAPKLSEKESSIVSVLKKIFKSTPSLGGLQKYFGGGSDDEQKKTDKYKGGFITSALNKVGPNALKEIAAAGWDVINPANLSKKAIEALGKLGKKFLDFGKGVASGIGKGIGKVGGVLGLNKGGRVPGVGNRDTVPAMLTPGEFVMNKRATAKIGVANLAALNGGMGGTQSGGVSYYHTGGFVGSIKPGAKGEFVKALEYLTGRAADGTWDAALTSALKNVNLDAPAYTKDKSSTSRNANFVKWLKSANVRSVKVKQGNKTVTKLVGARTWGQAMSRYGLTSPQMANWYHELQPLLRKSSKSDKQFVDPKFLGSMNASYGAVSKNMLTAFGALNKLMGLPAGKSFPGYPVSYAGGNTKTALKHALDHVFAREHDQFAFRPWKAWTPTEAALINSIADTDRKNKWLDAMTTLAGWGLTDLVNDLTGKGYADEAGFNIAMDAIKNRNLATQLNEQLRIAGSISDEDMGNIIKLLAFLSLNPEGKGLRDIARHLGLSDFQTVRLWEAATTTGRLSSLPSSKLTRMNNDVASYRSGVFYANTGGLVPGVGNKDTVPAMLTPGEFVLKKEAAKHLGLENLWALNSVQRFNSGGLVMAPSVASIPTKSSVGVSSRSLASGGVTYNINNNYDIDINNPIAEKSTRSMMKALQRQSVLGKGGSTVGGS